MNPYYQDDLVTLWHGDCVEVMRQLPEASVHAVVTDPPYGLEFMGKDWDKFSPVDLDRGGRWTKDKRGTAGKIDQEDGSAYGRVAYGANRSFTSECLTCGKRDAFRNDHACAQDADWRRVVVDQGPPPQMVAFTEWSRQWAVEAYRVLKPGGHLLAFGGTRTWHRLAVAIEDAGFEVRDSIAWQHSSPVFCGCSAVPYIHDPDDVRGMRQDVHDASGMGEAGQESDVLAAMQREGSGPRVGGSGTQGSSGLDSRVGGQPARSHDGREQPSVAGRRDLLAQGGQLPGDQIRESAGVGAADGSQGRLHHGAQAVDGDDVRSATESAGSGEPHQPQPAGQFADEPGAVPDERGSQAWRGWPLCGRCGKPLQPPFNPGPLAWQYGSGFPKSLDVHKAITKVAGADAAQQWQGWGTALKPAFEPIVVARKPLDGTVAENVLRWGTGALNIDESRIGTDLRLNAAASSLGNGINMSGGAAQDDREATTAQGRWPANVILDESQAAELDRQSGVTISSRSVMTSKPGGVYGGGKGLPAHTGEYGFDDTGGASRFFYVPKANASERPRDGEVAHPTVKPLELMRYLVKLVTPPGGTVLEPFAGSGTTLEACVVEGFAVIGIELTEDYLPLITQRITKPTQQVLL